MKKFIAVIIICLCSVPLYAADPVVVATFESLGITWDRTGGEDGLCHVEYRVNGEEDWIDGHDLWWDSDDSEYRGSIVLLEPDTQYDIRLTTDGDQDDTVSGTTWSETFNVGTTVELDASSNSKLSISTSGSAGNYRLYTRTGGATIDGNDSIDHGIFIDANYIIIRGVTIRETTSDAISIGQGAHDIIIEDCDISAWGSGLPAGGTSGSSWADNGGIATELWDGNNDRVIIQRNRIHDPYDDANSWCEPESGSHPYGPSAINIPEVDGQWVIRYNSIYSAATFFEDAIMYAETGNTHNNHDIYGNYIQGFWDDGIQIEGDNENIRIWNNFIVNTHHAFAMASGVDDEAGPLYVFNNVAVSTEFDGWCGYNPGGLVKTGSSANGAKYIYNNTMLYDAPQGEYDALGMHHGIGQNNMLELISKNNILQTASGQDAIAGTCASGCSHSYNLYYDVTDQTCTTCVHSTATFDGSQTYDITNQTGTVHVALTNTSDGYDDGVAINNFMPTYEGTAPDAGAQEYGTTGFEVGVDAYDEEEQAAATGSISAGSGTISAGSGSIAGQ